MASFLLRLEAGALLIMPLRNAVGFILLRDMNRWSSNIKRILPCQFFQIFHSTVQTWISKVIVINRNYSSKLLPVRNTPQPRSKQWYSPQHIVRCCFQFFSEFGLQFYTGPVLRKLDHDSIFQSLTLKVSCQNFQKCYSEPRFRRLILAQGQAFKKIARSDSW